MYDEDESVNIKGHCIPTKEAVNTICLLGRKKQQPKIELQRKMIRKVYVMAEKSYNATEQHPHEDSESIAAQKDHTTVKFLCCCMEYRPITNNADPNITSYDLCWHKQAKSFRPVENKNVDPLGPTLKSDCRRGVRYNYAYDIVFVPPEERRVKRNYKR